MPLRGHKEHKEEIIIFSLCSLHFFVTFVFDVALPFVIFLYNLLL